MSDWTGDWYFVPGFAVRDHTIDVPLDYDDDAAGRITLFYREVTAPERRGDDLPLLLHLQGGPGGKGERPMTGSAWLEEAVKRYRVIIPDQRGTGRSTRVDGTVIARFPDARSAADYLSHFLADSIVRDFELLRTARFGGRRWHTIGQSYGGFLTLTYLSLFPEGLASCRTMGGIPGVPPKADDVYRHTYPRAARKTRQFYARYPQDVATMSRIADRLAEGDVRLPNGDPFSVARLQGLGSDLGMQPGFERLHWLLDEAFDAAGELSSTFLYQVLGRTSNADSPLYWTLQEFIYGNEDDGPIDWAAQRELANHPEFGEDRRPLMLFGEMAFPWMFDEISELKPFKPAVDLLMQREVWPKIYDVEALAANEVPLQALVYFDDLYVDSGIQLDTLSRVGNAEAWVTNEYQHDGIRHSGVFTRLDTLLAERGAF
ncbi:alpha/beta fold hydrolase [Bifidobacterium simiarum]|uniref:alpha/beta fold hydrolase n=1 Tax=Bifidobacterium simiarum TaxID=2045441 RepID=UPI001BDC94F0|nr:alpha/beta fold hydrolase [Bifidobacterium simiarum]MBT1165951.1 alpha/beta fold hydrolase [Bifidobacterium simiarum]